MIKGNIILYIGFLNDIGGIEQWYYAIAKKYGKDNDIKLVYKYCPYIQLERLAKLMECIKYEDEEIECDKIIFCYDLSIIDNVKANEYILVVHADYEAQGLKIEIPEQITNIYVVSDIARKGFEKVHKNQLDKLKLQCKTLYNPVVLDEPERVIKLISATRLTPEKGLKRMELLATRMNEKGIPFVWLVFTDKKPKNEIDGFIYMKPRLDILGYIKNADYLVQLSDTESFGYSIVEALCLGTPVLTTDFPVTKEIGIKDNENGYIFKMDMSNIDENIEKIYSNNLKGFKYNILESEKEFKKIMNGKVKSNYIYDEKEIAKYKNYNTFITLKQIKVDGIKIPPKKQVELSDSVRIRLLLEANLIKRMEE